VQRFLIQHVCIYVYVLCLPTPAHISDMWVFTEAGVHRCSVFECAVDCYKGIASLVAWSLDMWKSINSALYSFDVVHLPGLCYKLTQHSNLNINACVPCSCSHCLTVQTNWSSNMSYSSWHSMSRQLGNLHQPTHIQYFACFATFHHCSDDVCFAWCSFAISVSFSLTRCAISYHT
jgi:hypothetical protein